MDALGRPLRGRRVADCGVPAAAVRGARRPPGAPGAGPKRRWAPQAGPPFRPSAKGRNVSNLRLSLSPAHFFPAFSSAIACFSFFTFGAITYEQ